MSDYEIDDDSLRELESAIYNAVFEHRLLSGKEEIIGHFEREDKGRWRSNFTYTAMEILGLENSKKNRNTISRDVQGSRLHTAPKKGAARERYADIAKGIGPVDVPKHPAGGYMRLRISCWVKMSGDKFPRLKQFTAILDYDDWWPLAQDKDYIGILNLAFEDYELEVDDIEEVSGLNLEVDIFGSF